MGPFLGFLVGFFGALAAVRRASLRLREGPTPSTSSFTEAAADQAPVGARQRPGLMPDEQLTDWLRAEYRRLGVQAPFVDITTVDGVVFLRGRESDSVRVDTMVSVARSAPGFREVVDEVKRD